MCFHLQINLLSFFQKPSFYEFSPLDFELKVIKMLCRSLLYCLVVVIFLWTSNSVLLLNSVSILNTIECKFLENSWVVSIYCEYIPVDPKKKGNKVILDSIDWDNRMFCKILVIHYWEICVPLSSYNGLLDTTGISLTFPY